MGGKADVTLDPVFAQIVHSDDYHVFLTPRGDCKGLYVSQQSPSGFSVQELQSGAASLGFSYRVVAKRADIKGERLAKFDPPKIHIPDESKLPLMSARTVTRAAAACTACAAVRHANHAAR